MKAFSTLILRARQIDGQTEYVTATRDRIEGQPAHELSHSISNACLMHKDNQIPAVALYTKGR